MLHFSLPHQHVLLVYQILSQICLGQMGLRKLQLDKCRPGQLGLRTNKPLKTDLRIYGSQDKWAS